MWRLGMSRTAHVRAWLDDAFSFNDALARIGGRVRYATRCLFNSIFLAESSCISNPFLPCCWVSCFPARRKRLHRSRSTSCGPPASRAAGFLAEIPAFDASTNTVWVAGVTGVDVLNAGDRQPGAAHRHHGFRFDQQRGDSQRRRGIRHRVGGRRAPCRARWCCSTPLSRTPSYRRQPDQRSAHCPTC